MSRLRIAMRADGSARIGTGHITRCIALARALRQAGAEVRFITRRFGLDPAALLHEFAADSIILPAPAMGAAIHGQVPHAEWAGVNWDDDATETIAALRSLSPAQVVIDHYAFDARWHRRVKSELGCALVVIDDLADRDLDGTVLIDHNLAADHRVKYRGLWPADRPLFGGPRFALLDERYATATRATPRVEVRSVGIFMGGADAAGYSVRVLEACRVHAGYAGEIEVATTRANPAFATLQATCTRWPRTRLLSDLPDLADFHARQDLEIGAGGGASWERCCIGVPTLLIATADNQRMVVEELVRRGAAATTLPALLPDTAHIAAAVSTLIEDAPRRASLAAESRRLVDGLGATRVALRMAADTLRLRPARLDDAERIFLWRNHPEIRAMSTDPAEIEWDAHCHWFERVLADPARFQFIAQIGARDVGAIRFDRRDDGFHEISLFLDPALQGLGLGSRMLRSGEAAIGASARFRARVVAGNSPSQQMFAAGGYFNESPGLWLKESK
jgi:UDP-2,4-diacetamido-2,4,6-trideoxy-beta-L-altropyranose hydrolase